MKYHRARCHAQRRFGWARACRRFCHQHQAWSPHTPARVISMDRDRAFAVVVDVPLLNRPGRQMQLSRRLLSTHCRDTRPCGMLLKQAPQPRARQCAPAHM